MRLAFDATASYSDNPSAFLALNTGNQFFTLPGLDGVIAYRPAGRYLVQFAGPFAPEACYSRLLAGFLAFAAERRRRVVAVQLHRADAERYAGHGFTVNQLGASYVVDLAQFTTRGTRFVQLRNKVSRAHRSGLRVDEAKPADEEERLAAVDREWLRAKGRHVKPLRFLVGERGGQFADRRRLFVGYIDGAAAGYVSYSPVYGSRPGWLHDLSRRRQQAPPGVLEAINMTAIERFRSEDVPWLHFGFTPFTGLDPATEVRSASPLVARAVRFLAAHGSLVYPARSQLAYKEKWSPHVVLPDYIAFQGRPRAGAVWRLLRVANAV